MCVITNKLLVYQVVFSIAFSIKAFWPFFLIWIIASIARQYYCKLKSCLICAFQFLTLL